MLSHSTGLLTSIFKRTATYSHIHRPLDLGALASSLALGPQLLPSSSSLLTKTSWLSSEQQPNGCHRHRRMGSGSRSLFLCSSAHIPPHTRGLYSEAIRGIHRCSRPRSPGSSLNTQWNKWGEDPIRKNTEHPAPRLAPQVCPPVHCRRAPAQNSRLAHVSPSRGWGLAPGNYCSEQTQRPSLTAFFSS